MTGKYIVGIVIAIGVFVWGCVLCSTAMAQPTPGEGDAAVADADASAEAPPDAGPYRDGGPSRDAGESAGSDSDKDADKASGALVTAGEVVSDVRQGDWRHAAAGLLSLVMMLWNWVRKNWLGDNGWLSSDRGGVFSLVLLSLAGALVTSLQADSPVDWRMLMASFFQAAEAGGLFLMIKTMAKPRDRAEAA